MTEEIKPETDWFGQDIFTEYLESVKDFGKLTITSISNGAIRLFHVGTGAIGRSISRANEWLFKRRIHYFVKISTKAKCPACGIRKEHSVKWSPEYERVIHICSRCEAAFAESPIASIDLWRVKVLPVEHNEEPIVKKPS